MPGNFLQNDLNTFLNPDNFGSYITITPQPRGTAIHVNGIFDNATDVYDVNSQAFLSSTPQITCKSVDVSGVAINDLVQMAEFSGTSYYVMRSKPDGEGITTIELSETKVSI